MGNYSEIDVEVLHLSQLWSGVKDGNFLRPKNYRIPELCPDCPVAQDLDNPQISSVVNTADIFTAICKAKGLPRQKLTGKERFKSSILVLNDEGEPTVDPVYLGDVPWVDPLACLEDGRSILLGEVHENVDRCNGPRAKKKFLRDDIEICGAGLLRLQAEVFDLRDLCGNVVQSARVAAESPRSKDDIKPEPSRRQQYQNTAFWHNFALRAAGVISEERFHQNIKDAGIELAKDSASVESE